MNKIRHIQIQGHGRAILLCLMLFLCINVGAQSNGGIVIGGDVYGGGHNGAVGTDNASIPAPAKNKVKMKADSVATIAASVTVYDGTIRSIFGGGENGRTYGSTSVTVEGANTVIGRTALVGTVNGGLFGAGDGDSAYVFGHSNVLIKGGTINQNVYGGGNKADLMGSTRVTLQGGTLNQAVYGGSRLANIFGYSLVDIDGAHATQDLIIKAVYGGNDIAGHIEASNTWDWTLWTKMQIPSGIFAHTGSYGITTIEGGVPVTQYNSLVHASPEANGNHIFVGQVFGGGNGDYGNYPSKPGTDSLTVGALGTTFTVVSKPEVEKSYIELRGGTYGYVYGGGNNATVTTSVDICLDNATTAANLYEIDADALEAMGVSTDNTFTTPNPGTVKPVYQFDRVFGGNNKAEMKIQPKWHLLNATINNLYSGGNEGDMTYEEGLLLVLDQPNIEVNTVYGGCRRANVEPKRGGQAVTTHELSGYIFPEGFSARVYITAGKINNVYGGNDISGNVVGGNALDIRSSIIGDVYGGGNGSYAYTDNSNLASHKFYRDFYYDKTGFNSSAEALNAFRPNAQQAWIHVEGTQSKPTLIGGSLYCGGNSATLNITQGDTTKTAELNIGSYVIVDNVFLGSNGANMIDDDMIEFYHEGMVGNEQFNSMNMTNDFEEYIKGVSLGIKPEVSFNGNYVANSTQIGSFFLGGNLGSITASGKIEVNFDRPIIIYDKLVAGCNDANYSSDDHRNNYGIEYKGGITNNADLEADGLKMKLNISRVTLIPKKIVRDGNGDPVFDQGVPQLTWNKITDDGPNGATRLMGANIYGGCYTSGYINGGVEININGSAMNDDIIFDNPATVAVENSGIIKEDQQQDVLGRSMSVFGAGMGEKSEIWGNTTVNIAQNGYILQAFGGGERGIVGKDLGNGNYTPYNATVNLRGGSADEIYGGGFQGLVTGNTTVNVYSGNAVDVFGGSCNANVGGYASVYVGGDASGASNQNIPTVQNVFGGNDYGGTIGTLSGLISKTGYNNETIQTNTYVEYLQGRVDSLFGGSYGSYDYAVNEVPPFIESSFVNFKPVIKNGNKVTYVFGGGWGDPGIEKNNEMQQRSYVLVNAPSGTEAFTKTDIFGAGAYSGLGMNLSPADAAASTSLVTARVDLVSGKVHDVYGASFKSGFTRRTEVNVPNGSTINVYHIFGGGYGVSLDTVCDTYEATVNYSSAQALVRRFTVKIDGVDVDSVGSIYGGNNNSRRTLYSFINIESPVYGNTSGYTAPVYGAGYGENTWTQYTEINLKNGANVYEAYGGGEGGMVLNKESVDSLIRNESVAHTIGSGYDETDATYDHGGLNNALVHTNRLGKKTNTNVNIWKGAQIGGYCYGAGLGETALVSGTTYVGVYGGTVWKDLYAAGTSGAVNRLYKGLTFTPETHVYLEGGSVRNLYGGGWKGDVGSTIDGIQGNSHVIIGTLPENYVANETGYDEPLGFYKGMPTVQRNAYAGGEGGAVYGMANLTMNNGRIGYEYTNGDYVAKIEDDTHKDDEGNLIPNTNLMDSGNIFGGGYKEASDVDNTNILMLGGIVRNSLYGGGEIATVGHGTKSNTTVTIQKAGKTHVEMYSGQVLHDVFGGGKGYDNLGRVGENLHTDGYVFGATEVFIYGGKVGSPEGVNEGYGNVFGGGNVGYVYGTGTKSATDGYYYNDQNRLTEDCRVIVSPYAKVLCDADLPLSIKDTSGTVIRTTTFHKNEYVPTEYLNSLQKSWIDEDKHAQNKKLDWVSGVNIYNAVFAGGNVSSGSNVLYANTKTVFGNATATLNDVYHCDLITVGTEHIGGLYGDGNLTFVDGYRELNITNYGTDYYGQSDVITLAEYNEMNDRERAYFELKYKCLQPCEDDEGNQYSEGSSLPEDDLKKKFANNGTIIQNGTINSAYWVESGFCSIYAGRLLNTIQRADFVGVFGSRMVMQGAQDRVPSVVDYTEYTINRVGEVSLNQNHSRAGDTGDQKSFGNYFGIYNIVNHLGALTSDVDFYTAERFTKNIDGTYAADSGVPHQTYEDWKIRHVDDRKRNNGSSANKVALAAGVYLELTTEESTPDNKVWGVATGVMELDLINVMPGLGGGFVYAKNVHGVRSNTDIDQVTLSKYNEGANSMKKYQYTTDDASARPIQTSGNFIHSQKQIFDDCYPQSNAYTGNDQAPAHYWFIKGQIYLYNQYISAYTGAADAYSKTINIPLTVTAGSHGTLKLQNVHPNKYAYYSAYIDKNNNTKLTADNHMVINNLTYHLNDTITYWEWSMLSESDQKKFVDTTYVSIADCKIGETTYTKGMVLLPSEYVSLMSSAPVKTIEGESVKAVYHMDREDFVPFTDVFRSSNNISHDNGYILTFDLTNPVDWDTYYSPNLRATGDKKSTAAYNALSDQDKGLYMMAPTYTPSTSKIYGQRRYNEGELITESVKNTYDETVSAHPLTQQEQNDAATFERAYVLSKKVTLQNNDGTETYLNAGYVLPHSEYQLHNISPDEGDVANYCTNTFELKKEGYEDKLIYQGMCLTRAQIEDLVRDYICNEGASTSEIQTKATQLITESFTNAYVCTHEGMYGGGYYSTDNNYSGLKAWSALTSADRENFSFNYDALDLLIDPKYSGDTRYYDAANGNPATQLYSAEKPLDYNALYKGSLRLEYKSKTGADMAVEPNTTISRAQYEEIPNERYHYAPFEIKNGEKVYIVKESFVRGDVPYSVGNKITKEVFDNLGQDLQLKIDQITGTDGKYYYCRQGYTIETVAGRGTSVTSTLANTGSNIAAGVTVNPGSVVNTGFIINEAQYLNLINLQTNFNIYGKTPVVTSTFYVSGQSNIQDLSKGKVMTVIYQYNYEESDETGNNIEPITERHIINIHIQFKSGTPTIGQLGEPSIVLPGSSIGLTTPIVKPGAYEVIGGGWELFPTKEQAEKHVNGIEFDNVNTRLYWYQNNGYHVAYYAKTYLGKTYSNPVRVRVANYHDLDMVMRDSLHHMYIDNPNVERNSKIYIDGRDCTSDRFKSKLDLLKDLFDLSLLPITLDGNGQPEKIASGELKGHVPLDENVKALSNLEFILRGNVAPKKYTNWTSIGNSTNGFAGTLHGDGYTISGLTNSLFYNLCDSVYNLGVTGSFTGSGIADNSGSGNKVGYAENCWIMTTSSVSNSTQPVLGNGGVTVNCYYPDNLTYATKNGTKAMPLKSFYNGEVTYNLNGFYLTKRYADNNGANTYSYKYYEIDNNSTNTLKATPTVGYYNFSASDAQYGYKEKEHLGYVESRYIDGDFVYANGTIPTSANERRYTAPALANGSPDPENGQFFPIWPDDYIFFGQMLTYGHVELSGREYQQLPTRINKADRGASGESHNATQWLVPENLESFSNRVYRAPAYFGNSEPKMVHYNAYAVIPAKTKDNLTDIYPGLTAVDFTAKSDLNGNGNPIWAYGWDGDVFNRKVLDPTKLVAFNSEGQTHNLLVYTDDEDDADILSDYFDEPAYAETHATNRTVALVLNEVKGHLVMKDGNTYKAAGDHYLVDGHDFNAPISYSFGTHALNDYYHMWYQRMPRTYVKSSVGGWETISLPFTAELVTTQQKGEITHFYTGSKVGHEYWLREFNTVDTQDDKAEFSSLAADANGGGKTVQNTFLWTYYYSKNSQKDARGDTYQTYYNEARDYNDYPLYAAGVPYLIGFPGDTYYEFDLSGLFVAKNTASSTPVQLDAQVITFVSGDATVIGVTDTEYTNSIKTDNSTGYSFVPTYQTRTIGDAQTDVFLLADNGTKMVRNSTATTAPFRAYLTGPAVAQSNPAPSRKGTRGDILYISYTGDSDSMEETAADRGLYIYNDHMNICVESTLEYPTTVTISNVAGKILKQFTIQPGTKVTVPVNNRGVYIVNRHKIAVTK